MISWIKNRSRKKRLFVVDKDMDKFVFMGLQNATSRAIRLASQIKQNYLDNDLKSAEIRSKQLRNMGLIPPSDISRCDRFIKDLTELR